MGKKKKASEWAPPPASEDPAAAAALAELRAASCACCQGAPHSAVLVVGSGSSAGLPAVGCLRSKDPCRVCIEALTNRSSRNRRNNPSLLIKYYHGRTRDALSASTDELAVSAPENALPPTSDGYSYILIDCGKTFRDAALSQLIPHRVPRLDAVIITHNHADAIYGLDDLRDWRGNQQNNAAPLTVYVTERELETAKRVFPYLVDQSKATGSGVVGMLSFLVFSPDEPLNVSGLDITPLRVHHGLHSDGSVYECLGFKFGDIAYVSDCNFIPDAARAELRGVDTLFIDALNCNGKFIKSHNTLEMALAEVKAVAARRSILIGLGHSMDYYKLAEDLRAPEQEMREQLGDETAEVIAAYDGLCFTFDAAPGAVPEQGAQQ